MKKIITIAALLMVPFAVSAQDFYRLPDGSTISRQLVEITATIFTVYLFISFILSVIRMIQDYRLKSKLMEKTVSDKVVEQFLQPFNRDSKAQAIKWVFMLVGIGVGLSCVSYWMPLGLHSLAIMAFSIAAGFLGYFFYLKKTGN